MAVEISTLKPLNEGYELTTTSTVIYTVPANTKAVVKFISIYNSDTSTRVFTIYIIPSGGAQNLANTRYAEVIYQSKTQEWECSHILNAGATIKAKCDANSVGSIAIYGMEITSVT